MGVACQLICVQRRGAMFRPSLHNSGIRAKGYGLGHAGKAVRLKDTHRMRVKGETVRIASHVVKDE